MSRATHIAIAAFLVLGSLAVAPSAHAAPAIGTVSPTAGSTNGGTRLNITGTGFATGAAVQFVVDSNFAEAVTLTDLQVTPTLIRAVTPPHLAGTVQVRVVNPDGSSALAGTSFTYTSSPPPSVTGISPTSGPSNGGVSLVIRGTDFSTAIKPHVAIVTDSHTSVATVQSANATALVVTTSAGFGEGPVVVTNPDGSSASSSQSYAFIPEGEPKLAGISPLTGPANGGTKVTLTGSNLAPGAAVFFGGIPARSVGYVSSSELAVVTPPRATGGNDAVEVRVINPDGQEFALVSAFTFVKPSSNANFKVTAVDPTLAPSSGGTLLTIRGIGFADGPGLRVKIGANDATDVRFVSSTHLTAVAPPCQGSCAQPSVTVFNPDGTESKPLSESSSTLFSYSAQASFTLSRTGVPPSSTTSVPTSGGQVNIVTPPPNVFGDCTVYVGGVKAPSVAAGCTSFYAPPGPAGNKDVTVVGKNGISATLQGGLGYSLAPPPDLTQVQGPGITNGEGTIGSNGRIVTLIGTGFIPVSGTGSETGTYSSPVVRFGTLRGTVLQATETSLTVLAPPHPAASINTAGGCPRRGNCVGVSITVTNIDGQSDVQAATKGDGTVLFGYEVDPPASLDTCVTRTQADIQDRTAATPGGGPALVPCAHASTDGGQKLTLWIDQGASPPPAGQSNQTSGMFVSGVVIEREGGQKVRIGGTRVTVGGNEATVLDIRPSGNPFTRAPGDSQADVGKINDTMVIVVPPSTRAGAADLMVINPDGTTSTGKRGLDQRALTGYYRYDKPPAPVLQQPDVVTGTANGGSELNINSSPGSLGAGATVFFGSTPVKIHFPEPCGHSLPGGGVTVTTNCVLGATKGGETGNSIRLRTPGHAPGVVDIRVVNLDGQANTYRAGFTFLPAPAPSLQAVTPERAAGMGGQVVTLVGANFAVGSVPDPKALEYLKPQVFVDNVKVPAKDVTVVNSGAIEVRLPDHGPGRVDIRVVNPDGQATTLSRGFRYLGTPTAVSVTPNVGPAGGGTFVGIAGKGFDPLAPAPVVRFGNAFATGVAVASPTLLVATVPPVPAGTVGPVTVQVIDQDGQTLTVPNGFTYTPPLPASFSSITPAASSINGGASVTLKGSGFSPAAKVCIQVVRPVDVAPSGPLCKDWSTGLVEGTQVIDGQTLRFVTPSGAAGPVDVCVINPQAASVNPTGPFCIGPGLLLLPRQQGRFVYTEAPSPIVTSVDPTSGDVQGGTRVTIQGANLAGVQQVLFDTAAASNVTATATGVTATTPPHAAGQVGVTVVSADGLSYTLPQAFTYTGNATVPPGNTTTTPVPTTTTTTTTTTSTGTGSPGTVTAAQITAANKQVTVQVTRDGDDNLVTFTLPLNLPATPQGVQVFRSNSPFVLLQTLDRTSAEYQARSYRDVGAPADSLYLVTVYYANGQGKATSSPDEVPGFAELGPGVSAEEQGNAQLALFGYIGAAVLGLLLIVLLIVLVVRSRRPSAEAMAEEAPLAEGDAGSEAERHSVNCPNCGAIFEAVGPKPLRMECPTCGKTGILR